MANMGSELRHVRRHEMKAGTARNGRPSQDGANMRPLRRAAGLILLFNGLLIALVLLKPLGDAELALVVNAAQFIGPLAATLVLRGTTRACGGEESPGARRACG